MEAKEKAEIRLCAEFVSKSIIENIDGEKNITITIEGITRHKKSKKADYFENKKVIQISIPLKELGWHLRRIKGDAQEKVSTWVADNIKELTSIEKIFNQ